VHLQNIITIVNIFVCNIIVFSGESLAL